MPTPVAGANSADEGARCACALRVRVWCRRYNVCLVTLEAEGHTGDLRGGDQLSGAALKVSSAAATISAAKTDAAWQAQLDRAKAVGQRARYAVTHRCRSAHSCITITIHAPQCSTPHSSAALSLCVCCAQAVNKTCASNAAKIQKFAIVDNFSVESGEFTPTLKLKRSVVEKQYTDVIRV
jgi:hypothetical protein